MAAEGDQYMTQAITPTNAINRLFIDYSIFGSSGVNGYFSHALFQDATAGALTASKSTQNTTGESTQSYHAWGMQAATVSSTTFKVRAGVASAGTFTFCGEATGAWFGGVTNSWIRVTEIMT
jgi:hypothetical protein